jgi:hypothetical protein
MEQFFPNRPAYAGTFSLKWLPFAAPVICLVGVKVLQGRFRWLGLWQIICWCGLFLMLWTANGLPMDFLHMTGLMPNGVDWPGMTTRVFVLAATFVLAHLNLTLRLLAGILSLQLVSRVHWIPSRLLLIAGWSATAIVAMIGPLACWSLTTKLVTGIDLGLNGIASWVSCLFYSSWFLWSIAAGAATRSYQLRNFTIN